MTRGSSLIVTKLMHGDDADFIAYERRSNDGNLADGLGLDDPADGVSLETDNGTRAGPVTAAHEPANGINETENEQDRYERRF